MVGVPASRYCCTRIMNRQTFEEIVRSAIETLPAQFRYALVNVAIVVEDEPDARTLTEMGMSPDDELFGLYVGTPLTERDHASLALPDRILIYRGPLTRTFSRRGELTEEIRRTVLHELGHHMGLEEDEMPY